MNNRNGKYLFFLLIFGFIALVLINPMGKTEPLETANASTGLDKNFIQNIFKKDGNQDPLIDFSNMDTFSFNWVPDWIKFNKDANSKPNTISEQSSSSDKPWYNLDLSYLFATPNQIENNQNISSSNLKVVDNDFSMPEIDPPKVTLVNPVQSSEAETEKSIKIIWKQNLNQNQKIGSDKYLKGTKLTVISNNKEFELLVDHSTLNPSGVDLAVDKNTYSLLGFDPQTSQEAVIIVKNI
jgi:hypothetical protein